MEPQITDLEQYHATVQERLKAILPALQRAAVGDFSIRLPIPETIDEFTPLYLGVNLVTEDLNAFFEELKNAKSKLEISVATGANELEKAIMELRQSSARTRSIFENAGEGMIAINTEGLILLINRAALELTQECEIEVIGKHCQDVFHCRTLDPYSKQTKPISDFITHHLLKGEKVIRKSAELVRRNGSIVPVEVVASPIISYDTIEGAIIILRDLSKEREIEKVKSDLVSFASHQLLAPLTAIQGYAEMLKDDTSNIPSESQVAINRIIESSERMKDVIHSFLNASTLETGKFSMNREIVAVPPLLTTIVAELSAIGLKKRLHIQLSPGSPNISILADQTYLMMAIQNVLSNAIKYTPEGGRIHLRCFAVNDEAVIEVEDTGRGIPEDEKQRIFEKLFRAKNAVDEHGNGLGLHLVQKVVQHLGGTVTFQSEVNKGTTFVLRFPIARAR